MVKKALWYLQGTKGLMLTYRRSDSLQVEGYSDSDFAGDIDDRKSMSGYVFTLTGGAISWKAPNSRLLHRLRCMQNLWHVMRPPVRLNG